MNDDRGVLDDGDIGGWPDRWRSTRSTAPTSLRSRVLAAVDDELATSTSRSVEIDRSTTNRSAVSWSWLAMTAVVLVLWIHASWGAVLAAPAPHLESSSSSLEAHYADLIKASQP